MMFNKKISAFGLSFLFATASAFAEGESIEQQQTSLLQKLDSLNAAVLGLKLDGTIKAGAMTSMAKSDKSPTQENQAFTDANLVLTARPSSETQIHLELRLHKDWQSAFDENNNPVIGHWFSYDGSILNKHLDFNLGYMRVGFTPYTLYTPQQKLLQEPEVFAQKRVDALAMRNLDTTSRRLMQGLNVDYHSGKVGPLSDIHAQATGARIRNNAKKYDQVFFDFDYSDRYFYGLRAGAESMGARLGVNYTDIFDRLKSSRANEFNISDTIPHEENSLLSVELGFDSKELLNDLPVSFGLNGEYAMSKWTLDIDYMKDQETSSYTTLEYKNKNDPSITNMTDTSFVYVKHVTGSEKVIASESVSDLDGTGFYVEPFVKADIAGISANLKVMYLQNDKDFWSEMASSPVYRGGSVILNSNALYNDGYSGLVSEFGTASLENMYFAVYNSNPLNASNMMARSGIVLSPSASESNDMYVGLYNNFKNAHFYRNAYSADVLKRTELENAVFYLDPANDMAMPFGLATPDRKGLNVSLDLTWNDAVELNALFSMLTEEGATETEDNKFTRYAAGLGIDVGRLIGMDRKIKIQGSYDHAEESESLKRKNDRIMAGLDVDVYGPVALLAGYQMSTREFGLPLIAGITKAEESLLLAGPKVKIAPNSYLSLQYGMLTDKVTFMMLGAETPTNGELSIDKNVIIADVTVNF